jgi:hypothetical protein
MILLSKDDFWSRWFRRRSWWPFTRSWMFEDIEDIFREMEDLMEREFGELSAKAPKELVRERTLPSGAKVKRARACVFVKEFFRWDIFILSMAG